MEEILTNKRELVRTALENYFQKTSYCFKQVNQWGSDLIQRLKNFTLRGKLLRGSLLLFTREMFGREIDCNTLSTAVVLELLQTGLLIHDDIMDRDLLRRGEPTILAQFKELGSSLQTDAGHFGMAMGICSGDVAFFLAFEELASLNLSANQHNALYRLFSNELVLVGFGQMDDLYFSALKRDVELVDIINIYRYKTARYTFVLPLLAGAILSMQDLEVLQNLEEIGLNLGIIFQIKDDELGLFGNQEQLGKPVGSDIAEGKKTIFYYHLLKNCTAGEKISVSEIFGNSKLTEEQYRYIIGLIEKYQLRREVNRYMELLRENVLIGINNLKVAEKYREQLLQFLEYNFRRQK